jgi:hypothetical protein
MTLVPDWFEGFDNKTKVCSICKKDQPVTNFGREGKGSNGYLRYECRDCAKKNARIVSHIKKNAPPAAADHRCFICDRTADELSTYGKKKKSVWVADHNHATEKFRDWLCHKCNMGLGNLADSIERCKRAVEYLSKHNESSN